MREQEPKEAPDRDPGDGQKQRSRRQIAIAVVGSSSCQPSLGQLAFDVGREIARRGAVLLCGGRGGVMEHSAAGARSEGGRTIGILPGRSASESPPNQSIDLPIFTGIGQARNQVLVLSAQAVIAIGGGWGTLSEIGLAMKHDIPVVLVESWHLTDPTHQLEDSLATAMTSAEAVARAFDALDIDQASSSPGRQGAHSIQEPTR